MAAGHAQVQAQLLALSRLCWGEVVTPGDSPTDSNLMAEIIQRIPITQPDSDCKSGQIPLPGSEFLSCRWALEGFPKGPALLSYLYTELQVGPCYIQKYHEHVCTCA